MLIVIIFIATLIIGVPVMAVLGLSTVIPLQIEGSLQPIMIAQALFSGVNSFPLIAVSGFLFAGKIMEKSGITDGLLDFSKEAVGRLPGGYAITCIIASAFFGALTGSGPACTAAIGSITIPLMLKGGYDKSFTSGVAAAGGSLGIMIPPSNPMVIYALVASVSVGDMFIAGVIPGILTAVIFSLVCVIIALKRGYHGADTKFTWKALLKASWAAKWCLLAPIIILGSIYAGVATPTEASIIACVYALVVGFINRKLKLGDVVISLKGTAVMGGSIMAIVGISTAFARMLTINQIPQTVAKWMTTVTSNPILLLLMIMGVMIFVGMWMEPISSLVILVPIFLPIVRQLGYDPIAFGILLVLTTQIAFITPPVAANLYVVSSLMKAPLQTVSKGIIPFILSIAFVCLLIIFFPTIATWLPSMM